MIREIQETDLAAVVAIADSLPEWFDETARHRSIPVDIKYQRGLVAISGSAVVGFVTWYVFEGRLCIGWLGVRREFQRQGFGRALLRRVEEQARKLGIDEVATYTLGESVEYAPYELTRKFYFDNGFEVYQRSQTDNPGCPEEIRIRKRLI